VHSLASAPPKGASRLGRPVLSVHSSLWPKGAPKAELNYSVLLKDPPSAHTGWECLMPVCVCGRPCAGVQERMWLWSLTSPWAEGGDFAVFVSTVCELCCVYHHFQLGMGILVIFFTILCHDRLKEPVFCCVADFEIFVGVLMAVLFVNRVLKSTNCCLMNRDTQYTGTILASIFFSFIGIVLGNSLYFNININVTLIYIYNFPFSSCPSEF